MRDSLPSSTAVCDFPDSPSHVLPAAAPQARGGNVKALAITGDAHSPLLPGVPTYEVAGVADASLVSWYAVAAPDGRGPFPRAHRPGNRTAQGCRHPGRHHPGMTREVHDGNH